MDCHERFGDSLLTVETVSTIRRKRLGSLGRATACSIQAPLTAADLQGQSRARRLLDVHLHQLASHSAIRSRVAARYKEQGLVVIGVHTPEFSFEEDVDNVRRAAQERGVTYPIAIDNDRAIWHGFGNHYWPASTSSMPREGARSPFGEGNYEESEMRIRQLLAATGGGGGRIVSPFPSTRMVRRWGRLGQLEVAEPTSAITKPRTSRLLAAPR